MPSAPRPAPEEKPVYNHLADSTLLTVKSPLGLAAGALSGGALGALAGSFTPWSVAPAIVGGLGAVVGGYLGNHAPEFLYSGSAKLRERANRADARRGERLHEKDRERHPALEPLGGQHLVAARATGVGPRRYDGFDSSRDLVALYTRENRHTVDVQAEVAHLRAGAEHGHLDTSFEVNWGKGQSLSLHVDDSSHTNRPLAVDHNPTFSRVNVRFDKELLRERGWTEGMPLHVTAETHPEGSPEVICRLESGDVKNVFRWEGKLVYYAVTDRFQNSDKTNDQGTDPRDPQRFHGGDWQGVIDKLEYLEGLGVNCVWLSCPYENQRDFMGKDGFHAYWPTDFRNPDPGFGDRAKLRELVAKAHDKGIKVMLDVVVNHTGYGHDWVTDPDKRDWFHREGNIAGLGQWEMENGSLAGLPDLDQNEPAVAHYLIDAHKEWLADGVDAFRLDAVRHVPEPFLARFNEAMKAQKPDFYSVGEAFWQDVNFVSGYQNRTLDGMFDFPLAYAIRKVFAEDPSRSLTERVKLSRELASFNDQESFRMLRHGQGGESMKELAEVLAQDGLYDNPGKLGTLIDNHDMVRFMSDCGGRLDRLEIALAFLMGCRGTPHLYYGTEVGMEGMGADNRNDMEFGKNPQLTERFQQLATARAGSQALQYGTQRELAVTADTYAFSRMRADEEVVCAFNNADEPRTLRLPLHEESQIPEGAELHDLVGEGKVTVKERSLEVTLPAKGYSFLQWSAWS